MEDMASLWSYQESTDELKQKLLYTTLELESVKMEANEEISKNTEYAKQLLQLLKITCQERDEAREQIHKLLLNNLIPSTPPPLPPPPPPQQLFTPPIKANSSITESNSLSYSSPADSFFDSVSSPELSTINMADSSNLLGFVNQCFVQDYDHACLIIEKIVKGKALPRKGELLQSVVEAGPLLQSLLVAGPLPRWRNPPPPLQPLKIPPVSINECGGAAEVVAHEADVNYVSFVDMSSCGSSFQSQMLAATTTTTTSVLDFGGGVSGSCLGGRKVIPAGANANDYVQLGKRQRLQ